MYYINGMKTQNTSLYRSKIEEILAFGIQFITIVSLLMGIIINL